MIRENPLRKIPKDMVKGSIFLTENYGEVMVLSYNGCRDVEVKFLVTGSVKVFPAGDIRRGLIKDPSAKRVCNHIPEWSCGDIVETSCMGKVKILQYENSSSVTFKFLRTGYVHKSRAYDLIRGCIRDPYQNKVYGVGVKDVPTEENNPFYVKWKSMLQRCYGKSKPCYMDVSVCEDWLTFSNFKEWMEQQDWRGNVLDKDLINKRAKVYSPATCMFISKGLNSVITTYREGGTKGYYFNKEKGLYQAQCRNPITNENEYLGRYDTESQAHSAFVLRKQDIISEYISNIKDLHLKMLVYMYFKDYLH